MIKISVIVPVYNMSKYLNKCLDSLVNQTFKDYEIIIINDGSTDNSLDIIKEYKNRYPDLIIYYDNQNQGISKTRNQGIEVSKGEYIMFIDSDDYVDTTILEKAYKKAINDNLDMVVFDYYDVYEKTNQIIEHKLPDFNITNILGTPLLLNQINYSPWNKLYKKELWLNNKFPVLKYEDLGVLPRVYLESKRIGKINECLNYYLIRNNSETTTMNNKIFDILKIMELNNTYFKENDYLNKIYDEIEYLNIYHLTIYIIRQRYQKDKAIANKFINEAYEYLNNNYPNWRKNKYYKKRNILKQIIETNKGIATFYCNIYRLLHK